MKKMMVFLTVTALLLVAVVSASAAWSGVTGKALASDNTEWQYGGTVVAYVDTGGGHVACGSDTFTAGTYSITFSCGTPANFTNIFLEFTFNAGPNGTPPVKSESFVNFPSSTGVATVNTSTQTGPTAVTVTEIDTSSSDTLMLTAVGAILLLLIGGTFVIINRRENF